MANLESQAALEQAVADLILDAPLGYTRGQVERSQGGNPPPRAGKVAVSVWSDGARESVDRRRTAKDERFGVFVTVTIRCERPYDQWHVHRDEVESRLNAIEDLVAADSLDFRVIRRANALAGFRTSSDPSSGLPAGFCEALAWWGRDPVREVGPEWFHARVEGGGGLACGLSQRVRFGAARRIRNLAGL